MGCWVWLLVCLLIWAACALVWIPVKILGDGVFLFNKSLPIENLILFPRSFPFFENGVSSLFSFTLPWLIFPLDSNTEQYDLLENGVCNMLSSLVLMFFSSSPAFSFSLFSRSNSSKFDSVISFSLKLTLFSILPIKIYKIRINSNTLQL